MPDGSNDEGGKPTGSPLFSKWPKASYPSRRCFDAGVLIRTTGDIVALSPPLMIERAHIDRIVETLSDAVRAEAA